MVRSSELGFAARADPVIRGISLTAVVLCGGVVAITSMANDIAIGSTSPVHVLGWVGLLAVLPIVVLGGPAIRYSTLRRSAKASVGKDFEVLTFSSYYLSSKDEQIRDGHGGSGWMILKVDRIEVHLLDREPSNFFDIKAGHVVEATPNVAFGGLLVLPTFRIETVEHLQVDFIMVYTDSRDLFGYRRRQLSHLGHTLMKKYGMPPDIEIVGEKHSNPD